MVRSVLSILAGIVVLTVASFAMEAVLNPLLLWGFPQALPNADALRTDLWARSLMFAYGFVCVAAGGYVAARIATRSPMRHAAVLGVLQAGLTIAAMFSPEGGHASKAQWVLTAVLSVPAALAGGALVRDRTREGA